MSEFNTGGPAFPHDRNSEFYERTGMTLRDYFAAKAMQGYLSSGADFDEDGLSEYAYRQADSMLQARVHK